ncbi:class I adenylate-forming enzyme family protein [Paraburkholderia sp. IW21]|uniref:class I adenylate-forming enzyme family protein n=1 Tax=Paraburkholderia sp. IW21 TaxID=3242488 RepID=UPI003522FD1C
MPDTRRAIADPAYRTIGALLDGYRRAAPHKAAIIDVDRDATISFGELAAVVDSVARQLLRHGARAGSRIMLVGSEGPEKLLLWLAVWRIGAVVCPLDIAFVGAVAASHIFEAIDPSLILLSTQADANLVPATNAPLVRVGAWPASGAEPLNDAIRFAADADRTPLPDTGSSSDVASMCCTSGTTGMPKVVVYDHACYWLNGLDSIDLLGFGPDDRMLEYRSFDWYSAQILSLAPFLQTGSTLCIARRFSRSRFAEWVARHRITVCAGVPTVLNMLLEGPLDVDTAALASLRAMTCSTAPLSTPQWARFEARYGVHVINLYGSSEAGWMCGNRVYRRKFGTIGYPAAHIGFDIVDADGESCGPDEAGQVVVSGPKLALGLMRRDGGIDPIRGAPFYSRDIAARDTEGFVRISGRMDDLIIRGGVKIVPQEIEDVLLVHPQVQDAAAVGVPDPIYGQEPVCFVVPRPGSKLDARQLLAHCRQHLAREKLPKQFFIVDTLPRSARGKFLRDVLRRDWWIAAHRPEK